MKWLLIFYFSATTNVQLASTPLFDSLDLCTRAALKISQELSGHGIIDYKYNCVEFETK